MEEIKRIPEILEDPVLILKSKNDSSKRQNTRMVIFGSVKAKNGSPILAVLDLRPVENNLVINDMQKVTSSYTKDSNPVKFVRDSDVLYADKKRAVPLLRTIGFPSPIELQRHSSIGSIFYRGQNVNIIGDKFSSIFLEQKGSLSTTPSGSKPLSQTSKTLSGTASNPTISQDNSGVNTSLSENGEKDTSWQKDITERHSLNPHFSREYDAWDKKSPRVFFKVGTTSKVLQGLGIPQKDITLDSSKVIKIRAKHPGMSDDVIKQVPYILEYPVVVMQSKTDPSRITIFGDVIDADGKLVLAALELHPDRNGIALDEIKIASAYGKDNPQRLLDTSPVLYVDGNKKRTNAWERFTRLQLPVNRIQAGSNPTISQDNSEVNTSISENGEEDTSFLEQHSLRMVSIPERDYRALVSRNEELEAKVKYLMLEFRPSVKGKLRPNQNRMDVTVGRLLRESGSAMDKATLAKRMQTLWNTVYNSEDLRFEDAMALAMDIAGEIKDPTKEILRQIRAALFFITKHQLVKAS